MGGEPLSYIPYSIEIESIGTIYSGKTLVEPDGIAYMDIHHQLQDYACKFEDMFTYDNDSQSYIFTGVPSKSFLTANYRINGLPYKEITAGLDEPQSLICNLNNASDECSSAWTIIPNQFYTNEIPVCWYVPENATNPVRITDEDGSVIHSLDNTPGTHVEMVSLDHEKDYYIVVGSLKNQLFAKASDSICPQPRYQVSWMLPNNGIITRCFHGYEGTTTEKESYIDINGCDNYWKSTTEETLVINTANTSADERKLVFTMTMENTCYVTDLETGKSDLYDVVTSTGRGYNSGSKRRTEIVSIELKKHSKSIQ